MIKQTPKRLIPLFTVLLVMLMRSVSAMAADFLDPEQAFRISAELTGNKTIALRWSIAKSYKLYKNQVTVEVTGGQASLGDPVFPEGIPFTDPTTGQKEIIYHDELKVQVPLRQASAPFTVSVGYQGCSEDGLCYPPVTKEFRVDPSKPGALAVAAAVEESGSAGLTMASAPAQPEETATVGAPEKPGAQNELSLATSTLESGSWWKIAAAFLFFGLLLSFTPCVLPMLPILSSIIVGEGQTTRTKSFLLALAYCLGMTLVYTALGVAAGLAGEGLAGALQKPWVLVMFSVLLIVLSLSMFDVYQLQVPASMQNSLNKTTGQLKGGKFAGVFLMGAISALIIGPCVAAPLAGTLVYISQTKDVFIGGLALFSMAMGMSVPLLLIGLSAGSLLPKAGAWMVGVKYVFGLLLIGVAIWMVTPVLPPQALMAAWGALGILSAVFAGVFSQPAEKLTVGGKFTKALGLVLFIVGVMELVGAASGGTSVLQPLSGLRAGSGVVAAETEHLEFRRVRTVEELERELQASAGKPVMLDFYADWCVSCKEMEKFTLCDPKVREALAGVTLLQVDVTANTDDDKALMKRFGLFGPPGIIFFDRSGQEITGNRIVGFVEAEAFLGYLERCL
ncbi:MAG: protein-disulfide reductase DsbD [Chlorobiaceae bacterium]|nr:protein-disulfide reductase DsbD [Chlorobiaceae bacterium]